MTVIEKCLVMAGLWIAGISNVSSQIVINEIMFNPSGSENTDEFVEIVNVNPTSMDLSGWSISDGDGVDNIIDAGEGMILGPSQIGIVLDADYLEKSSSYESLIPDNALILAIDGSTIGSGGLSNSRSELVQIINADGDVVDSVRYNIDILPGHSYEHVALDQPSSDPSSWKESLSINGTPGFRNSVAQLMVDLEVFELACRHSIGSDPVEVVANIQIRNPGASSIISAEIDLFDDVNFDSTLSSDEKIETQIIPALAPKDSVLISFQWSTRQYGKHVIGVEVILDADENPQNNCLFSEIQIPYPQGTLVINEIMADPLDGSSEWIELFNPQNYTIDLLGWKISDSDTSQRHLISESSSFIPSGGYAILSENDNLAYELSDALFIVVLSFPSLNNSEDGVFLFDPSLSVIDGVDYDDTWGGGDDVSLERIRWDGVSQNSSNWHGCTFLEGMTPGTKNSVTIDQVADEIGLQIHPNPFSPDGDGIDEVASISYKLPCQYANITLSLYDVQGRRIRDLRQGIESSGEGVVLWDGKDNSGRMARLGIYIAFLEALDYDSGKITQRKATVVLGGAL